MNATNRAIKTIQMINRRGWSGDVAVAAIAAFVVGFPTWLWGPGGALWGVPISMVWAGVAAIGGFFCSLALYSVPNQDG